MACKRLVVLAIAYATVQLLLITANCTSVKLDAPVFDPPIIATQIRHQEFW